MKTLFPLAVITDEVSQELKDVIRFCKENEVAGVEIRSMFGRAFKDLTTSDAKEISKQCGDAGLKIVGAASPVFKCDIEKPDEINAHLEIFKRSVETAHHLGCKLVRVFTFLRRGALSTNEDIQRAASHFPKLGEIIKGTDIKIGVENEASALVGSGAETKTFLAALPADLSHVGVVWDPCNVLYVKSGTDPIKEDYPMIANRVVHVHVKDSVRGPDGLAETCIEVGKGSLNFPGLFAALKAHGYKGWISLETHWRFKVPEGFDTHLPAGYSFSAGAEEPSKICMKNLRGMLTSV